MPRTAILLEFIFGTQQLVLADVGFDEFARTGNEASSCEAPHHLARDIVGDIPRPSFGRVEGDDPHRIAELAPMR